MASIRQDFVNESYLKPLVLRAFVSFLFFKKLGILPQKEHPKRGGELMTELKEKAEGFFARFPDCFYTPVHKVVFLLGVLTEELLRTQRKERQVKSGKEPFRKNLRGLRLREDDFRALLPRIQNKLEEYGRNYPSRQNLEKLISAYFLQTNKNWRISANELNFYFVLGMNLVDEVGKVLGLTEEKEVENV